MYKVRLSKIESTHENLRTPNAVGTVWNLPEVGKNITLVGEPLNKEADARIISTTEIKEVEDISEYNARFRFKTLNSTYELEVLEDLREVEENV